MLPQEIEVWYVLPALRRELAKNFVKVHGLSQKKAASILSMTEAAISQYLGEKRGQDLKFNKEELTMISETANKILEDEKNLNKYLYELSVKFRGIDSVCKIHMKMDKSLPKDCKICMGC